MSQFDKFQGNEFYLRFYKNTSHPFRDRVNVYENNQSGYILLTLEERCAVDFDYLVALYEISHYEKFLNKVDDFIETIICENVTGVRGIDVYAHLLFIKNISLFRLRRFNKVLSLSNTLLKMKEYSTEERKVFKILIYSSIMSTERKVLMTLKSSIIFCAIIAVFLKIINIFYFEPFRPEAVVNNELGIVGFLSFGVVFAAAMLGFIWFKSKEYFGTK